MFLRPTRRKRVSSPRRHQLRMRQRLRRTPRWRLRRWMRPSKRNRGIRTPKGRLMVSQRKRRGRREPTAWRRRMLKGKILHRRTRQRKGLPSCSWATRKAKRRLRRGMWHRVRRMSSLCARRLCSWVTMGSRREKRRRALLPLKPKQFRTSRWRRAGRVTGRQLERLRAVWSKGCPRRRARWFRR